MKKLLSFLLTIILIINFSIGMFSANTTIVNADTNSNNWPAKPSVFAKSAVLIDASTGTVLYDKKCHKKMYPASITKIMTALLTIENCKMDDEVTFSEKAVNSIVYGEDANFGCQIGEKMSIKDCLYVLMLKSANEVAAALGEHIAGTTEKFAAMMNERAKKAGATDTHFMNANGLHNDNHYVTAYDMAMITRDASKYSIFNEIVNTTTYTVKPNNKRKEAAQANQRHKMVWPTSGYYYDGIIGGKTGYTDQSGTTLVTYAKRNGMTLIAVVLHSNGTNVYKDTKTLLDYGFNNFNLVNVSQNDSRFATSDNTSLPSPFCKSNDTIYIDTESTVIIPKNTKFSSLTSQVQFNASDDAFGTITYKQGDVTVGTAKLKYKSNATSTSPDKETIKTQQTTAIANTNNETVKNSNNNSDKKTTKVNNTTKQKKDINLSKLTLSVIIIAIIVLIITFFVMQQRRLNKIRAMKRNRKR